MSRIARWVLPGSYVLSFLLSLSGARAAEQNRISGCLGAALGKIVELPAIEGPHYMIRAEDHTLDFDAMEELVVVNYNAKDILEKPGQYYVDPATGQRSELLPKIKKKPELIREQTQRLLDTKAHIINLVEVESLPALNTIDVEFLGDQYRRILIEGNDSRGIDIGFLYRKDLPL